MTFVELWLWYFKNIVRAKVVIGSDNLMLHSTLKCPYTCLLRFLSYWPVNLFCNKQWILKVLSHIQLGLILKFFKIQDWVECIWNLVTQKDVGSFSFYIYLEFIIPDILKKYIWESSLKYENCVFQKAWHWLMSRV